MNIIVAQSYEALHKADVRGLMHFVRKEKDDDLREKLEKLTNSHSERIWRAVDLAREKVASN